MTSKPNLGEEEARQRLDLEIIDLDESRDSSHGDTGFGSGGGGSSASCGSSSGCDHWTDNETESGSSTR
jgi:hypothetical protein